MDSWCWSCLLTTLWAHLHACLFVIMAPDVRGSQCIWLVHTALVLTFSSRRLFPCSPNIPPPGRPLCVSKPHSIMTSSKITSKKQCLSQHDPNTCVLLYYTQHLSRSAPQYSHLPLVANNRNDFLHIYQFPYPPLLIQSLRRGVRKHCMGQLFPWAAAESNQNQVPGPGTYWLPPTRGSGTWVHPAVRQQKRVMTPWLPTALPGGPVRWDMESWGGQWAWRRVHATLTQRGDERARGLLTLPNWDTVVWSKDYRKGERRERREAERRERGEKDGGAEGTISSYPALSTLSLTVSSPSQTQPWG